MSIAHLREILAPVIVIVPLLSRVGAIPHQSMLIAMELAAFLVAKHRLASAVFFAQMRSCSLYAVQHHVPTILSVSKTRRVKAVPPRNFV